MERINNYNVWGNDGIDPNTHEQMLDSTTLPCAAGGALMADAHKGYGLPIGGVLATEGTVIPYAVGVDISCSVALSVYDLDPQLLDKKLNNFIDIIENSTIFGVGKENNKRLDHPVLHKDWNISPVTKEMYETAKKQIGTSGSGNHFLDLCILTIDRDDSVLPKGRYIGCITHSGSRGTGAAVCSHYSNKARTLHPEFKDLAWLDIGSKDGDEYFAAMNLMHEYAAANHELIHQQIAENLGKPSVFSFSHSHNLCWEEEHDGKTVYVHRKGATPAFEGMLGIIPGSMGSPIYLVKGKGNKDSYCSASHGAGRVLSRSKAKQKYNLKAELGNLKAKGVHVISCGVDEVPGVYKNIDEVMAAQTDLVEVIGKLEPKIVKMSADGRRED